MRQLIEIFMEHKRKMAEAFFTLALLVPAPGVILLAGNISAQPNAYCSPSLCPGSDWIGQIEMANGWWMGEFGIAYALWWVISIHITHRIHEGTWKLSM